MDAELWHTLLDEDECGSCTGGTDWAAWVRRGTAGGGVYWTTTLVWECPQGELTAAHLAASQAVPVHVLATIAAHLAQANGL